MGKKSSFCIIYLYLFSKYFRIRTLIELLKPHNIQINIAAVGKAEEKGYAEQAIRTIKEGEVDLSEYVDFADTPRQKSGQFLKSTTGVIQ